MRVTTHLHEDLVLVEGDEAPERVRRQLAHDDGVGRSVARKPLHRSRQTR